MSKTTRIIIFFIAFVGVRFVSTKVQENAWSVMCYNCASEFDFGGVAHLRNPKCETLDQDESCFRENPPLSHTQIKQAMNNKFPSSVCTITLVVSNLGLPQGIEHYFARVTDKESHNTHIMGTKPWGPKEKLRCLKELPGSGHKSLENIPVRETVGINCVCISDGCNNMSMDQLIKDFPKL